MQVFCKLSGQSFETGGFPAMKLEAVHPIFYASTKQLLSRTGDWAAGKLDERERRLLFLALLHHTDLVEFRVTAMPADSTVQLNMEAVIKFVGWMLGIHNPQLALPRFVISPETKSMDNVKHWIEAWRQARRDFDDGYTTTGELARLRNREVALERMIKNAGKKTEDYAGMLGAWVMDATNAPKALHAYWLDLFRLKGINIYQAVTKDLEELLEHMEENLEHGSIYSASSLKHIRLIVAKNKTGLNFGLGIPDEELEKMDFEAMSKNPYSIIEDSIEIHNVKVAASAAPEDQPQLHQYTSRILWLKAKAAWNLAQKAKEYAADATGTVVDDSIELEPPVGESMEDATAEEPASDSSSHDSNEDNSSAASDDDDLGDL